jgi:hypothetical protein
MTVRDELKLHYNDTIKPLNGAFSMKRKYMFCSMKQINLSRMRCYLT